MYVAAVAALLMTAPAQPRWVPPVPRPVAVVRAFDPPAQPWLSGHRGVDVAASAGATIRAASAGRVSFAGPLAGRGVVVIVHGELRSTYEPVTASVGVSALVGAGDPIGVLETGHQPSRPTAAVLHWGVRRGETYLDPMALLGSAKPVRLLPHWRGPPTGVPARTGQDLALPQSSILRPVPHRPRGPDPVRAATVLAAGVLVAAALVRRPP